MDRDTIKEAWDELERAYDAIRDLRPTDGGDTDMLLTRVLTQLDNGQVLLEGACPELRD